MFLGDAVSKQETFVWILNHVSRSITSSLFILNNKSIKLSQMTNFTGILHVVLSDF